MKKYFMILTAAVMVLMLAACGSSSEAPSQDEAPAGEQEPAAEEEETAAPEVNPYAWLGFQDIPECDYMDALASNHYYKKSEVHIDGLSYVSKQINAVDGINTYKEDESSKVWSVGGKIKLKVLHGGRHERHGRRQRKDPQLRHGRRHQPLWTRVQRDR